MKRSHHISILFAILLLIATQVSAQFQFQPSKFSANEEVVLVAWNSEEGIKRLNKSKYKNDFYQLADRFQPQINPLYCGIATTTIVLNTFRLGKQQVPRQKAHEVAKPKAWGGDTIPYPSYSQWTLLNENTDKVKAREVIRLSNITTENTNDGSQFSPGLSLEHLAMIQNEYGLKTEINHASLGPDSGVAMFREDVIQAVKDSTSFVVVNFVGNLIGTTTGGHISPLAAYHKKTDSVLVLDVAGHKNPWYWVPVEHLYKSMHTKDGEEYRGWVVITN